MVKKNKITLNEEEVGNLLQESFFPSCEKVLVIKKFLDKSFIRQLQDDIDINGYPTKLCVVVLLSSDGMPLRTMNMKELLLMLDDKFNHFISKEHDRREFLKQVIRDWFDDKISKQGLLSVNFINSDDKNIKLKLKT